MPTEVRQSSASGGKGGWPHLSRGILFTLICILSTAGVVAYALHSRQRTPERGNSSIPLDSAHETQLAGIRQHPYLLFRNTTVGASSGLLSMVRLDDRDGARYATDLNCERVYGTAHGGVCLQATRGVFTSYRALHFDEAFRVVHTYNLPGTPSRTRVSKDGRLAATTVFVKGDSYNSGGFSTRTSFIDLSAAKVIADLEEFAVTKDGKPFRRADFNFWGVTFAPGGDGFFATLATGGVQYLVEGSIFKRSVRVIREGMECPSLSPDGKRLAFKSRVLRNGHLLWNLRVLTLETGSETVVNEDRSVDDQAEWLDAEHVLYGLPRNVAGSATSDIWIARADGEGNPRVFLAEASSPCVIRP